MINIEKIREAARTVDFSGVISIYEKQAPRFHQSFGYRDIKNEVPNTPGTLFGIASGTKLFTALGIGVLIDRGKIAFDTPVCRISQKYRGFIDDQATVLHLLTHTSGIYDYYDEELEEDSDDFFVEIPWYRLETPGDYFPLFAGKQAKFPAGQRFSYSNGGYVFLGILIEKITGRIYREFMENEVFRPAGMERTGFYALNDLPENTANGYLQNRRETNIYHLPIRGGGDGGLYTTSADLNAFWDSFLSSRILSERLTSAYLRTRLAINEKSGYGCGIYKRLDDSMYFIVGGDAGVGFDSRWMPKEKLILSILSNVTDGEERMRDIILSMMEGE